MECNELVHAAAYERFARRNNSLGSTGRILVFTFLFFTSAGIAGASASLGAWRVMPFAGIAMIGLYLALAYVDRHAADFERVAIACDPVKGEVGEAGRARAALMGAAGSHNNMSV